MTRIRRAISFAVVLLLVATGRAGADTPLGPLPEGVTPTHYSLDLRVVPTQDRFQGVVTIDITLAQATPSVWLHGEGLSVTSVKATAASGAVTTATWTEVPGTDGVAQLQFAQPLPAGRASLKIEYTAPFNRDLEGLYRTDEAGKSYAFSQMEPIFARRAFPCFDEPRFKTPFDIALTVRKTDAAISNAPVAKTEDAAGGLKRVQFATTKPLPTYLIALIVGPLDVVDWPPIPKSAVRDREIPLRGIAAKGKGPQMTYALSHTAGLLTALESYFGIPYPYDKLDLIAAIDFEAGAMENAGAIVYREPLMLFDDHASLAQKRSYVTTHTHEMSHQWVGDLVTPKWWNDIWLNEAFATWKEYRTAAAWDPDGQYGRLLLTAAEGAMSADSWPSARRIAQPISSNDDIENAFDSITYEKGAGVLAMFEQYYGPDIFRKGVQTYLQRHAFGNATTKDFLDALAQVSGKPEASTAFRTFLDEAGLPLVRADLTCDANGARIALHQSRYLRRPAPGATQQLWDIPICLAYGDDSTRHRTCTLMNKREVTLSLEGSCPTWVMPNEEGAGYYRFALSNSQWPALIAGADRLSTSEVLAALDSLDAGFAVNLMDVGDYLHRMRELVAAARPPEGMPVAWDVAGAPISRLVWIKDVLLPPAARPAIQQLIGAIYGPWARALGLTPTTPFDKAHPVEAELLRSPVIAMAGLHGRVPEIRNALVERGLAYLGMGPGGDGKLHQDAVIPALVEASLAAAVQDRGTPVVDRIMAVLESERDAIARARMLSAMTRSTDPAIAARVRALALDPVLRVNEVPIVVYGSVREQENIAAGWGWFKANFAAIEGRTPTYDTGDLTGIGHALCTPALRDDYKAFFEPKIHSLSGAPRAYALTMEQIDACIDLVGRQRQKAVAYFAAAEMQKP